MIRATVALLAFVAAAKAGSVDDKGTTTYNTVDTYPKFTFFWTVYTNITAILSASHGSADQWAGSGKHRWPLQEG